MKKCKRWIAVLLISVMCLSLCGCQDLEDMRAAHALWQEDGSILWNGDVYRLIENVPESHGILYGMREVYVTEADVPVLLSQMMGNRFDVTANEVILSLNGWDGGRAFYCREDRYDFMAEHLRNLELVAYYYTYWFYDADAGSREEYYYLSEVQGNTINRLINTLVFTVLDEDFYYSFDENDFSVVLGKCDDEHLFGEDYIMEIVRKNGQFYLVTPDNYFAQVPSKYDDIMKTIVSVYYNEEVKPYL